jgi:hypothetical protein
MKDPMERSISSFRHVPNHEALLRLVDAARWFCVHERAKDIGTRVVAEPQTSWLPARRVNAKPRFDFAVYSLGDGSEEAELEVSCISRADAERIFRLYQTTTFTNVTFFLLHWSERRTLRIFRHAAKA